jgi:hypothetical protein
MLLAYNPRSMLCPPPTIHGDIQKGKIYRENEYIHLLPVLVK